MGIEVNEISKNAKGGTEMMAEKLRSSLSQEQLDNFQITPSRMRKLDPDKIRIFWAHDLPGDPESNHLKNNGWEVYHKIVFCSHWQQQMYINYYGIPWSKTVVLQNAIQPIEILPEELREKYAGTGQINLVYHTTPHRGLNILLSAFSELAKKHDNIHLDVFSSFEIYGWKDRDESDPVSKEALDRAKNTKRVTYHGTKSNDEVREYLKKAHIFAYPSIWPETSCIALMEAMSAGCICVHPDFAALPETAANWTTMYTWQEDPKKHLEAFYLNLSTAIKMVQDGSHDPLMIEYQKMYADLFYQWDLRKVQWQYLLNSLKDEKRDLPNNVGPEAFVYKTG